MSSNLAPIDISNMPELVRIVEDMKNTKEPRLLKKAHSIGFSGGQLPAQDKGQLPPDFPWTPDGWQSAQLYININNISALRFYH